MKKENQNCIPSNAESFFLYIAFFGLFVIFNDFIFMPNT